MSKTLIKAITIVTLYKGVGAQRTSHALPVLERTVCAERIGWFHVEGGYVSWKTTMGSSKEQFYKTKRGVERAWAKAVLSGYTIVKDAPLSGFPS